MWKNKVFIFTVVLIAFTWLGMTTQCYPQNIKNTKGIKENKPKSLRILKNKQTNGFCCYKGQVIPATQLQCKKKNGTFYKAKAEALKKCAPEEVKAKIRTKRKAVKQIRKKTIDKRQSRQVSNEKTRTTVLIKKPGLKKNGGSQKRTGNPVAFGNRTILGDSPTPPYPAKITRVSSNPRPGDILTIHGVGFGHAKGIVNHYIRISDRLPEQEIILEWTNKRIQVYIHDYYNLDFCESSIASSVQVWPAAVKKLPSSSIAAERRYPYSGTDRYSYSGTEGPVYFFDLYPRLPTVTSMSPTEVSYDGSESTTIVITGDAFAPIPHHRGYTGIHGRVHLQAGGKEYPTTSPSLWHHNTINFPFPTTLSSGEYEVVVTVDNCERRVSAGTITFNRD